MNKRIIGARPESLAVRQKALSAGAVADTPVVSPQYRGTLRTLFGAALVAAGFIGGAYAQKKTTEMDEASARRVDLVNMANRELGAMGLQPKARSAFSTVEADPKSGTRKDCATFRAEARGDAPVLGAPLERYEVCVTETTSKTPTVKPLPPH